MGRPRTCIRVATVEAGRVMSWLQAPAAVATSSDARTPNSGRLGGCAGDAAAVAESHLAAADAMTSALNLLYQAKYTAEDSADSNRLGATPAYKPERRYLRMTSSTFSALPPGAEPLAATACSV